MHAHLPSPSSMLRHAVGKAALIAFGKAVGKYLIHHRSFHPRRRGKICRIYTQAKQRVWRMLQQLTIAAAVRATAGCAIPQLLAFQLQTKAIAINSAARKRRQNKDPARPLPFHIILTEQHTLLIVEQQLHLSGSIGIQSKPHRRALKNCTQRAATARMSCIVPDIVSIHAAHGQTDCSCQIRLLYSAMVRSELKYPAQAVFIAARCCQRDLST